MAKQSKQPAKSPRAQKLGRSAATGKYVLAPAAKKGGSISLSQAREVMRQVVSERQPGKKA